ncbi:MAG: hypothetical protein COW71_13095 [Ignavibacteriales bacterium CG18_big_fil_WC_8_21_14_2_50_31_20]|nr:MAG: hypothetical protein COW71_13095 [Ignavibacteriales bacterium CG18_big_fil_WC_8_21_14_2_50_31_20]
MGWFGDLCSSAWETVCSVGRTVVTKVAEFAGKALTKMAEFGEKVVSTVKKVWHKVKPYIEKVAKIVVKAKAVAAKMEKVPHPWTQAIAKFIRIGAALCEKGLAVIQSIENSPILKKIDNALKDILPKMKEYGAKITTWAKIQESRKLQNELEEIVVESQTDEEKALLLAKMLNKYLILKSSVILMIKEDKIENMEHYLQLMATEKIFKNFQKRISEGLKIDEIKHDDMFMFEVADVLISKNPQLSEVERNRFDELVQKMFGKPLLPVVFAEMVKLWSASLELEIDKRDDLKTQLARKEVVKRRLEKNIEFEIQLEVEELKELDLINKEIPELHKLYDDLVKYIIHQESYIYAAEGMQRALEENILEVVGSEEDVIVIHDQIPKLADLLISCFRGGIMWEELSSNDQSLIRDFANIFKEASKNRADELITVEVAA